MDFEIPIPTYKAPGPSQLEKDLKELKAMLGNEKKISPAFLSQLCNRYGIEIITYDFRSDKINKLIIYFRNHEDEFNKLKDSYLKVLHEKEEFSVKSCKSQADTAFQYSYQDYKLSINQ